MIGILNVEGYLRKNKYFNRILPIILKIVYNRLSLDQLLNFLNRHDDILVILQ